MSTRRLLIVDDSVVMRRALTSAISGKPDLEVAGTASNGHVALMKIPLLQPDVVALDLDMPGTGGMETLAAIRETYPKLPVVVLTAATPQGAAATVEALTRGASDFVLKPDVTVPTADMLRRFGDELASKVALRDAGGSPGPRLPRTRSEPPSVHSRTGSRIDLLAIGVSTGGPQALTDLIPALPADFPVPILIVQHMPPLFTGLLAERLAAKARIPVAEARSSDTLVPGHAWIAPGDFHMALERHVGTVRIVTHRDPPENSCRPAVDVLFRSAAQVFGSHVLAVVMTGMGQDGLRGCEHIREAGGQVLVQDEASSVVWGMPGLVARAGLADQVLPLNKLGEEIIERVQSNRRNLRAVI
jgi:two-component system chemotaxis response regulator CheB